MNALTLNHSYSVLWLPDSSPFPELNETPFGSAPDSAIVAVGKPFAVTTKVPPVPTEKIVLLALVIAGASSTLIVNVWVAGLPNPVAVKVSM